MTPTKPKTKGEEYRAIRGFLFQGYRQNAANSSIHAAKVAIRNARHLFR